MEAVLLGVGGLRWGEAAALRVCDIDFLRRGVDLHRNAVMVGGQAFVGSLKSGKSRTVVLPAFVADALAQTAQGKGRDDLLWPSRSGGYLGPPVANKSWLSGAVSRCQKADKTFPRVTAHDVRHTAASLAISAGGQPEGGSADARPRLGSDDPRCVRRSVRFRPIVSGGKCGQNVATTG
jgi:integrase